ncbi:hypothetical protein B0T21DRAFT_407864 [Apiosordaria backusii]|uniref:Uncharacterized protein n=1 Tax=Apiosordaria backusii TaxID=314023 RepID=A0AA40ESQ9_9PEZI|nr:hypothetical protein B0T21DRAFT_407864 [Apiosordaria backusii]
MRHHNGFAYTDSVQAPSTPDSVIEYAQFDVLAKYLGPHRSRDRFLRIRAEKLASPAIRHGYVTADTGWRSYAAERLRRWSWLELYKLEPRSRPFLSTSMYPLVSDIQMSQVPQSWDYADDQIPVWYREWEQTLVGKGRAF